MLRPVTPGGHPLILLAWLAALSGLAASLYFWVSAQPAFFAALALVSAALLVGGFVAYQARLRRFSATLLTAEEALDKGDIEKARHIVAPLLARFPRFPLAQEVAGDALYAAGDPLSAASLWESAMKRLGPARIAPRLVAAYAALNRAGDARRVAALAPNDGYGRLALAWCELAALGGDRAYGQTLVAELAHDGGVRASPSGVAMANAIEAIAAAQRHDPAAHAPLDRALARAVALPPHDRAFIQYLVGIARRELGDIAGARATFTVAMEASPESIGAALARRERSHLPK